MLINLKKKVKIKRLIEPDFVRNLLAKRVKKYYPGVKKIDDLQVEILRNFLGKFRNFTLRYRLVLNFGKYKKKKNILAKANTLHDNPKRWFIAAKILERNGFKKIPKVLDYLPRFNLVLYEEVKGLCPQDLLIQKKIKKIFKVIPEVALFLKKFHSLKIKKILPIKNKKEENKEHRHWLFLIKKCAPKFLKRFKKIYYPLIKFREKNKKIFPKPEDFSLIHGDLHFGNIILTDKKVKIIDFGDAQFYDPLDDLARFLAQSKSMLEYYQPPDYYFYERKIENLFLKNYFRKKIKNEEKIRITFFKVRNFLQMAGILSFIIWPKKDKFLAVKKSLNLAEKELNLLQITN